MNFKKSKLYKTIINGTPEAVMKTLWDYLKSGKDVNLKDETTGESLLHLLVRHGERFCTPETIQAIYMLVCKDVEIDAQNLEGETALHLVMRKKGTYRIMMAIVRCGIDTAIVNNDGKTAEEVLLTEKPDGWQEMMHWYNKYKPGLWQALSVEEPDRKLVEKLLKNWCRLTCIKNGKVTSIKSLVKDDVRKIDLLHMIEDYENANEMALALNAGFGFIVKTWMKQPSTELMNSVNPNTSDYSYQYNFPDSPEVPRPLLAAAWETNSYDTVDVLMDMKPNTRALYSNEPETVNPPKPLFFQLVCGNSIPADDRILLRIFRGSDLQARDREGQTILHKVVEHQKPENTFRILMTYGADIAARDRHGRTARDLALKLNRPVYSTCVDEHIIKLVKDKKFDDIERLILQSYDQLLNVTDSSKRTMVEIAKKYGNRHIYEVVKLSAAIQAYVRRVFQAVADGNMEDLKKLLSCKKYHNVRDKCGRTLLHKAVMKKRKAMTKFLIEEYPQNLNIGDTMDRTPLHYAHLFADDDDTVTMMVNNGANVDYCDAMGMRPADMTVAKCGSQKLGQIQKDVTDLDFNIYLSEKDFLASFSSAIQKGDLETVKSLVSGLRAFGDMSQFSKSLFECIDQNQTEIARFLIMAGFKTDIYKQYTSCDPDDPMCAMMECGHSMTSLKERATEKKCDDIVSLIDGISNGKVKLTRMEPQNGLGEYGI